MALIYTCIPYVCDVIRKGVNEEEGVCAVIIVIVTFVFVYLFFFIVF
jgi:hypothetical protein